MKREKNHFTSLHVKNYVNKTLELLSIDLNTLSHSRPTTNTSRYTENDDYSEISRLMSEVSSVTRP